MVSISTDTFPKKCFQDMARCFLEAPELPDYIRVSGPFFRDVDGENMQVVTIYEYDAERKRDANEFMRRRSGTFECVDGFKCIMADSWMQPRDALESMVQI
ncbi:MAG TPA: hypothetical protein PKY89_01885 [Deltaproteobacteria bacterium]|nr:hypothetical protein [Deltaproteobacteria bacterium]HPJ92632.1 hypothetical protein [Deltaproteobacteria bacterium]HPR55231.1 hypothetical protein [Deltaproteobacteria bacterium]